MEKYRLFIVDDEPNSLELIESMVNVDIVEIAGTAMNGIDALEKIQDLRPDILITDIRMPGCSGLELIEKVKAASPGTEIIVISGYREFEYLQSILKFGISEFLLKPIVKEELDGCIKKVIKHKTDERLRNQYVACVEMDLNACYKQLREKYCLDVVNNDIDALSRRDMPRNLISFRDGKYRVLILKLDCVLDRTPDSPDNMPYINMLLMRYRNAITNVLLGKCFDLVTAIQGSRIYFLCNYEKTISDAVFLDEIGFNTNSINDIMNEENQKYGIIHVSMGIGISVDSIEDISRSVESAREGEKQRLAPHQTCVSFCDSGAVRPPFRFAQEEKDRITAAVVASDKEKVTAYIQSHIEKMVFEGRYGDMYQFAGEMVVLARNTVMMSNSINPDEGLLDGLMEEKIDNCFTVEMLSNCLVKYFDDLFESIRGQMRQQSCKAMQMALEYIENNYSQQLTLQDVAEKVYYSPNYLGAAIKKETGKTFLEYLTDVRMKKSEELLKHSNYTIAEIASRVGYCDEKYFSKLFCKSIGIKPNEYRKFYG